MSAEEKRWRKITADYDKTQDIIKKRRQHTQDAYMADCTGHGKRVDFASRDDSTWLLLVMFPVYMIACGYLAYKCYPIRKEITYVLLVIMWLSYGAALLI